MKLTSARIQGFVSGYIAKADPKLPEIHLGMGLILLQLNRFDEALAQVEQELALVPDSKMAADAKTRIESEKAVPH